MGKQITKGRGKYKFIYPFTLKMNFNGIFYLQSDDTRPRILKRKNRIFTSKESSSLPKASTSSSGLKYIPIKNQSDEGKGGKIPRPPNAFMIFANEWRRRLATENPRKYFDK